MSSLRIPVSSISGVGVRVDVTADAADLQPEGVDPLPARTIGVQGLVSLVDEHVLFMGHIRGEFTHPCDRCLEDARHAFDTEVIWNFESGPPPGPEEWLGRDAELDYEFDPDAEQETEVRRYQNDVVDLGPHVWEEASFALPAKFLCREDCQGLCPHCGKNLNAGRCGCPITDDEAPAGSAGLAGLAELFPGLAPKETKE